MVSKQVLALYHPEKKTAVSSDATSFGLDAVLKQKQQSGGMLLLAVACVGRLMTKAKSSYAQL